MLARVTIKKTQKAATGHGVHDLINSGQAKWIFFVCLVEINIINTHPPIIILVSTTIGLASQSGSYTSLMKPVELLLDHLSLLTT
jgi:hypothetical protein